MSWRDELRKLDEELAAGQISADDYRMRRDQVLSSAVTSTAPGQPSPGDATRFIQPADTPGQQPPSPPAGTPVPPAGDQPGPGERGEADKTQVVPGQGADSDKTQIVPSPAGETTQAIGGWYAARPGGDPGERTQIVPGVPPQAVSGGPAPRPAPGIGGPPHGLGPEDDPGSPWSGTDFPPLSAAGTPDWIRQGPEVFEETGRGNGAKIAMIALAVIVLGGLVFGAIWLWGGNSNQAGGGGDHSPSSSTTRPRPTRTTKPPEPDPLPVAALPGSREESHTGVKSFTQVPDLNYLNDTELKAYQAGGAAATKFSVRHLDSGGSVVFLLVKASGADAAKAAAAALRDIQVTNGATAAANGPPGVLVTEIDAKEGGPAQIRAHYTHGDILVRVEVKSPAGLAAARADFAAAIDAQLKVLSADG